MTIENKKHITFGDDSFIHFTIPGQPMGKQRARTRTVNTKAGKSFVMSYTPKKTLNYETYIKELFVIKYPNYKILEGAISVDIIAYLTIPMSKSKKQKELMREGAIQPTTRPDGDNIQKAIFDALQGIVFKNDSQIVSGSFKKIYSDSPRVDVIIGNI